MSVPVTVSGNAVSVFGDARSSGSSAGAAPGSGTEAPAPGGSAAGGDSAGGDQAGSPSGLLFMLGGRAVPAVGALTTEEPTTPVDPPVTEKPATEKPTTEGPVAPGTAPDEPATEEPAGSVVPTAVLDATAPTATVATRLAQTGFGGGLLLQVALTLLLVGSAFVLAARRRTVARRG